MALSLNTEGLIPDSDQKKESNSRHVSKRKPIALNFSNTHKPQATSLAYWQKHKLATPLFWYIFDSLSMQNNPKKKGKKLTVKDVIENMSPTEYAEALLAELRSKK